MAAKKDTPEEEGEKSNSIVVSAKITMEDAKRIQQAFAEGKLDFLGISDVSIGPIEEPEITKNDWSQSERRKRGKSQDEGAPPL